jgi:hypothetical protein
MGDGDDKTLNVQHPMSDKEAGAAAATIKWTTASFIVASPAGRVKGFQPHAAGHVKSFQSHAASHVKGFCKQG